MDLPQALPTGTVLDGNYRIESVLGAGGLGITYRALDVRLGTPVAIKELFPAQLCVRDAALDVRPRSAGDRPALDRVRKAFLDDVSTLARLSHPAIVRVLSAFAAHGTAYTVMRFEDGPSLKSWLAKLGRRPTQEELDRMAAPLLEALEVMHEARVLHRDIGPDTIIIRPDGSPCLIDVGVAKRVLGEVTGSLSGIVKHGYAPPEQYATDTRSEGPWSDIYAVAATLYHAVAGQRPPDASERMLDDRMAPASEIAGGRYRPGFLAAIDHALHLRAGERPHTVAGWRGELLDHWGTREEISAPVARRASAPQLHLERAADGRPLSVEGMRQWSEALASARSGVLEAEAPPPAYPRTDLPRTQVSAPAREPAMAPAAANRPSAPMPSTAASRRPDGVPAPAPKGSRRKLAIGLASGLVAAVAGVALHQCRRQREEEERWRLLQERLRPDPNPTQPDRARVQERLRRLEEEQQRTLEIERQRREAEAQRRAVEEEQRRLRSLEARPDSERNLALFFASRRSERVDMSVFAPPTAVPGSSVLVQVFLHTPPQAGRAAVAARMMDTVTSLKGTQRLELDLARGARVDVTLSCGGLSVEEPLQTLRWRGEPAFAQFVVGVPAGTRPGSILATVRVSTNGDLIGRITFRIAVAPGGGEALLQPAGEGGGRYRYAFVSYASEDRRAVLERVQMLQATRTKFFQDLLSLDPGERWERALYAHIDACDLFLLFWSRAARRSEWVLKEVSYALERQQRTGAPDIVPVILEGPPPVLPPESLRAIHFDDRLRYFIAAS